MSDAKKPQKDNPRYPFLFSTHDLLSVLLVGVPVLIVIKNGCVYVSISFVRIDRYCFVRRNSVVNETSFETLYHVSFPLALLKSVT